MSTLPDAPPHLTVLSIACAGGGSLAALAREAIESGAARAKPSTKRRPSPRRWNSGATPIERISASRNTCAFSSGS